MDAGTKDSSQRVSASDSLEAWQVCDVIVCDVEVWLVCCCLRHGLDAAGHLVDVRVKSGISVLQRATQAATAAAAILMSVTF
jgi:hypothetical protein